jgi:hypothetical protein
MYKILLLHSVLLLTRYLTFDRPHLFSDVCLKRVCCWICSLQKVTGRIRERAIFLHRAVIFVLAVIFCVRLLALFAESKVGMSATAVYSANASQEISVTFGFTTVRGPVFDLDMQRYLTTLQLLVYSMRMFRRTMDAAEELGAATFLELKCVGRARIFSDYVLSV